MRKRNVNHVADTIFWYVIYMLPIILSIIQSIGIFGGFTFDNWQYISDNTSFYDYPFAWLLENNLEVLGCYGHSPVYSALTSIFNEYDGILPWFQTSVIYYFAEWFIGCVLVHLFVDFILFIPRFAHKWMKKATEED